jgi:endonuclease/exonuclease/phosphatase family metal-dependent hydrolase
MKQTMIFFALAGFLCANCSCFIPDRFTVMTYNVHNLFDPVVDGTEYADIKTPDKSEFADRCRLLADVILSAENKPDVIGLQEIESQRSLDGLRSALGPDYPYAVLCSGEGAIRSALISRWPLSDIRNHATLSQDIASRRILQAQVNAPFGEIRIFVVHLKSASEGAEETEEQRWRETATLLSVSADCPQPFIVFGDFNADPLATDSAGGFLPYGSAVLEWEKKSGSLCLWDFSPSLEGTYDYRGRCLKLDRIYSSFPEGFAQTSGIGTQTGSKGTSDHKAFWATWSLKP